jgi:transposase
MTKRRRSFSDEFKQEAVSLVVDHGYSLAEAGRSLGIRGNLIGRWKRQMQADQGDRSKGKLTPDQERIRDLEAEARRLKMEKDILKKAIFDSTCQCNGFIKHLSRVSKVQSLSRPTI